MCALARARALACFVTYRESVVHHRVRGVECNGAAACCVPPRPRSARDCWQKRKSVMRQGGFLNVRGRAVRRRQRRWRAGASASVRAWLRQGLADALESVASRTARDAIALFSALRTPVLIKFFQPVSSLSRRSGARKALGNCAKTSGARRNYAAT